MLQSKVKLRQIIIDAKIEILTNYWNKIIGLMQARSVMLKDKHTIDLINKIVVVPKHIRNAVL